MAKQSTLPGRRGICPESGSTFPSDACLTPDHSRPQGPTPPPHCPWHDLKSRQPRSQPQAQARTSPRRQDHTPKSSLSHSPSPAPHQMQAHHPHSPSPPCDPISRFRPPHRGFRRLLHDSFPDLPVQVDPPFRSPHLQNLEGLLDGGLRHRHGLEAAAGRKQEARGRPSVQPAHEQLASWHVPVMTPPSKPVTSTIPTHVPSAHVHATIHALKAQPALARPTSTIPTAYFPLPKCLSGSALLLAVRALYATHAW